MDNAEVDGLSKVGEHAHIFISCIYSNAVRYGAIAGFMKVWIIVQVESANMEDTLLDPSQTRLCTQS